MTIAVDTQALFSPIFRGRGIANYLHQQLLEMFKKDQDNSYILFNLYSEESVMEEYFSQGSYPNVTEFQMYTGKRQYLIQQKDENGLPRQRAVLKGIVEKFLWENSVDIFFYTSPFDHWNYLELEWLKGVKTVATVYDIIPSLMPEVYLKDPAARAEHFKKNEFIKGFDKILAISQSVKNDLVEHLDFPPEKIEVIYAGIAPCFSKAAVTQEEEERIRSLYGITGEYLFVAGGCDPRKNMTETVRAYAKLPQELIDRYQLVIVCKLVHGYPHNLPETAAQCGLAQDRVVLTGFVPDEDLLTLYRLARLTVFASQYEGFGLPVIESMACGTPVVTSQNSSLGEIGENAAVLVDPFDEDAITEGLVIALGQEKDLFAKEMSEKVRAFTWSETAARTLETIHSLGGVVRTGKNSRKVEKIAVFAPLPPLQSGIADYTDILLRAIDPAIQVDVFIDDGYVPAEDLPLNVAVYNHSEYEKKRGSYVGTLYQMGNNHMYHYYMLPYIKRFGGTVELHDVNLHNMLQHKAYSIDGDLEAYRDHLAQDYCNADALMEEIQHTGKPPAPESLILNGAATRCADKIIVHSQYARETLLEMDVARDATVVPHFAMGEPAIDTKTAKMQLGIAEDTFVVATFGQITETRRLETVIRAFATCGIGNAKLCITGGFATSELKNSLTMLVQALELDERIHFTDRLPEEELQLYISACDACVNLRWPYHGESSGILARVMQAGKPAIVTDIGSFGEIPDEACIKIAVPDNPDEEIQAVAQSLQKIINQPGYAVDLGKKIKRYAERCLGQKKIAGQIMDVVMAQPRQRLSEADLAEVALEIVRDAAGEEKYEIMKISETMGYLLI